MLKLKLSNYFQIIKPSYTYLRIIPNYSIRNNNSHYLAKTIAGLYKNMSYQIRRNEEKVIRFFKKSFAIGTKYSFEVQSKVAYYIYLEKNKVEFYFIVPEYALSIIKEKMSDVWGDITIEQVDTVPTFSDDASKYQLVYRNEDALSLATDRRDNDLLKSTLNIIDVLEEGDRAAVLYNFCPTSQYGWASAYRSTIRRVKQKIPVDRDKAGLSYILKRALGFTTTLANDISNTVTGHDKKDADKSIHMLDAIADRMTGGVAISKDSLKKATSTILNTQILVMSESTNEQRQRNNARSLTQSFDSIAGDDNSLVAKPYCKSLQLDGFMIPGAAVNKMSELECQNFLAVPGREILEKFKCIEKIETKETAVPEELREGVMCIGMNTFRGVNQKAYLSTHKEFQYLSTIIIGPNRAGKSTLIQNLVNDAITNGECVIVMDYIMNCELSDEIVGLFPKDKVLVIDCRDFDKLQGLGYNEIRPSDDPFVQWENAKHQATLVQTLLNCINGVGTQLTSKMERYLASACYVVFLSNGPLRDVFRVLQDHRIRHEYLRMIPESQNERMEEYVGYLHELDEYTERKEKVKKGNTTTTITHYDLTGTKDSLVVGIIDRLAKLKMNTFLELMLTKSSENNIDLVSEFQKNQIIVLKMPEYMFSTDDEKDLYATYWMTKIQCALQVRSFLFKDHPDDRVKVNMVIDELYQVRNCEKYLSKILSRLPKFRIKPIISCHYINQIYQLREELRSASPTYMLVAGCDTKNFHELQEYLSSYTVEDLVNLPTYHSLNIVKNDKGYSQFITSLPPKLKGKMGKNQKEELHEEKALTTIC